MSIVCAFLCGSAPGVDPAVSRPTNALRRRPASRPPPIHTRRQSSARSRRASAAKVAAIFVPLLRAAPKHPQRGSRPAAGSPIPSGRALSVQMPNLSACKPCTLGACSAPACSAAPAPGDDRRTTALTSFQVVGSHSGAGPHPYFFRRLPKPICVAICDRRALYSFDTRLMPLGRPQRSL